MRIRPPMGSEVYSPLCLRKAQNGHAVVLRPEENATNMGEVMSFDFDYVFDETDTQETIYEECVQEMVDSAIGGSSSTVFAYGQTGSGKTFTILGDTLTQEYVEMVKAGGTTHAEDVTPFSPPLISARSGMFNRVFADLFRYRRSVRQQLHVCITLSIIELYVDDVLDLLANRNKLKLRDSGDETFALGITTAEVKSMKEVLGYFRIANEFRSVSATKMNEASSRSHALFFIDIYQFPVQQYPVCPPLSSVLDANNVPLPKAAPGMIRSRISLVDLAGSERVKRSGAEGQRMKEAQAINKSLSSLGTVINAMYTKNPHIPFRESKLTRLLKPCFLQAQSRVLLIGQASPPSSSASETLGTLRFCDRVKGLRAPEGATFPDPEQEQAFLASKRVNHELCADLRIASLMYYHQPVRLRALAEIKGEPMESVRMQVEPTLRTGLEGRAALAETAFLQEYEATLHQQNQKEVEEFIIKVNENIEEYEQIAQSVKASKKAWKKVKEEQEKKIEEATHDAKKAKKSRLKVEEELNTKKEEAAALGRPSAVHDFDADDDEGAGDHVQHTMEETGKPVFNEAYEAQVTSLVEDFGNKAAECGGIISTYVSRLRKTANLRASVRRMKLNSSAIIAESTVIEDLIAFIIDRAVDISRGKVPEKLRWAFAKDVDGFNSRLKGPYDLYPPLLPRVKRNVYKRPTPLDAKAHRCTFLSSDDSDDGLSHYPNETRRRRVFHAGRTSVSDVMIEENLEEGTPAAGGKGGGGGGRALTRWIDAEEDGGRSRQRGAAGARGGAADGKHRRESGLSVGGTDWVDKMYEAQLAEEEAANEAEGSSVASSAESLRGASEESMMDEEDGEGRTLLHGPWSGEPDEARRPGILPLSPKVGGWDAVGLPGVDGKDGAETSGGRRRKGHAKGSAAQEGEEFSLSSPMIGDSVREDGTRRRRRRHAGKEDGEEPSGVVGEDGAAGRAADDEEGEEKLRIPLAGGEKRRHRRHRRRSAPKEGEEEEETKKNPDGEEEKEEEEEEGNAPPARLLIGNGKSVSGIIEVIRRRREQGLVGGEGGTGVNADGASGDSGGRGATTNAPGESIGNLSSVSLMKSTSQIGMLQTSSLAKGLSSPSSVTIPKPQSTVPSTDRTAERITRMHLMRVYDSPTLVSDLIKFLRGGTVMVKHGRLGKPHKRLFWVSSSRGKPELLWMDPDTKDDNRSIVYLDDVAYIKMGCFSKVFKRHAIKPNNPQFFLCFTIGLKGRDRTVDVVADSLADFEAWVVGLSWMIGVDPCWGGKPDISKEPGFESLSFFESTMCETHYVMPMDYLTLKQKVEERRAQVKEMMEKYPNDLKRVEMELDLIHPPEINERGALLLTKGELRFLCPESRLDIFRISYIWILFEQMGLVYDPKFSLPTAFGITKRE